MRHVSRESLSPDDSSSEARGKSPTRCEISSRCDLRASVRTLGIRPGSARASDPGAGRLLAVAREWLRGDLIPVARSIAESHRDIPLSELSECRCSLWVRNPDNSDKTSKRALSVVGVSELPRRMETPTTPTRHQRERCRLSEFRSVDVPYGSETPTTHRLAFVGVLFGTPTAKTLYDRVTCDHFSGVVGVSEFHWRMETPTTPTILQNAVSMVPEPSATAKAYKP